MTHPNPAAVQIGRSGGFDMYNSFLRPGSDALPCSALLIRIQLVLLVVSNFVQQQCRLQPPQLKLQREDAQAGKLSDGTQQWLPTDDLPDDKWLSPAELLAPFR